MSTVAAHLSSLVHAAVRAAGLQGLRAEDTDLVTPTKDAALGDYQSNVAFKLGKASGMAPKQAAEKLREAFAADPALAEVSVAGAGFLNLRLHDVWLAADVKSRANLPDLGGDRKGAGQTVVIDYSSPNVAKRLHIGHIRSTLLGDALARLHRFAGFRVVADNHLGDWGTPFGKLMVAWEEWRDEDAFARDPVGELQRLYQLADEELQKDPSLLDRARATTVKLQAKDPGSLTTWQLFVDKSMAEFQGIYDRLGVKFDTFHGESHYDARLVPLVDELLASGVAVVSDGAVVIPLTEKGLEEQPMLVRKADGAALYGTTDLATIEFRVREYAPARILYVVDTRQQHHFRQVFAAARRMGVPGLAEVDIVHVWFGMLKFADGTIGSSRKGNVINLVDLLDQAAERAYAVVSEKSPDLPEAERHAIAEVVGVGTLKYFDLGQNPQTDVTFTWERALSLDGGSAVYLQYAYARLRSILRKGGAADAVPDVLPAHAMPAERALLRLCARLPEVAQAAAESCRPNLLAEHLETLAQAVGPFYDTCPVLKDDVPADVRAARLALVGCVTTNLRVGLDLLGVGVVDRL
jgi:arginyl-tRNA synthetase